MLYKLTYNLQINYIVTLIIKERLITMIHSTHNRVMASCAAIPKTKQIVFAGSVVVSQTRNNLIFVGTCVVVSQNLRAPQLCVFTRKNVRSNCLSCCIHQNSAATGRLLSSNRLTSNKSVHKEKKILTCPTMSFGSRENYFDDY